MGTAAFMDLASTSERRRVAETALAVSSLLGFVRLMPHYRRGRLASTPGLPLERSTPSATRCHACRMFRPCGFSPPRRLAPRDDFGCIAIRAGQGSLRFCLIRPQPSWQARIQRRKMSLPRSAGTLRRTFFIHRHHHLSVLMLPSWGCRPTRADPKAFPCRLALYRALLRRWFWALSLAVAGLRDDPRSSMGFYTCNASGTEMPLTHRVW